MANELRIVVVVVGTSDALHALQTDIQVASRFEPLLIPRWTESDGFRAFVVSYGKLLPLRKASQFGEPAMIHALIQHSGGVTGRVTGLLGRAAEIAIGDGSEQIDANDVNAVNSMGLTALDGAANRGSDAIVRFLAEKGAALDAAAGGAWRQPITPRSEPFEPYRTWSIPPCTVARSGSCMH